MINECVFKKAFVQKLVYVYRINDKEHEGVLKVGDATYSDDETLEDAAKRRIREQTQTAGIVNFDLLYTESVPFRDYDVHKVLIRSGIAKKVFDEEHKANEWFYADLETVKKAILAAREGRSSLYASEISEGKTPIVFRPEQKDAINLAVKAFKKKSGSHKMLWNCKMRFGKTVCAHEVIKECGYNRTLILTHKPVVDEGWFEDYSKIFYDKENFCYGSKHRGESLENCKKRGFVYFASIQDMRGSEKAGGKFDKNEDIFAIDWELIIIDEAHEGTKTELGKKVLELCKKENTRVLYLSGTPFNLMDDFKEDEIYTWDYIMEQKAKADWEKTHFGDYNPYSVLPKMNIFTYDLGKLYPEYADSDIAFNFREFFRTNAAGDFVHKDNVKQFLDLMCKESDDSNYPYSKAEYRDNFRHSLWIIPGVKEAKALSKMLQEHDVFSQFKIANVAGDGDEEVAEKDALKIVNSAIGKKAEETYSITLSCGKLTTGVSVKPWTAVFMLSGSYNTTASTYMQTIFRVQTPAVIGGKQKEECFVFDFAPDRTLKVIAESAKISSRGKTNGGGDRAILGDFLNFCPIIAFKGSEMKAYDTDKMLGALKKAYVEKVVRNGFEDGKLYNENLMKLDKVELEEFDNLKKIIGTTKAMQGTLDFDLNKTGLTDEDHGGAQTEPRQTKALTEEERKAKELLEMAKKNRATAISILRGISIRMPMMIYGAELKNEEVITIDNFTKIVDDVSWKEFMPQGVTKAMFAKFKKYYDEDIFREAGVKIRDMAKAADKMSIEERIDRIASIFATFRNPDKETVLTPWRVVNMHLASSVGGWAFWSADGKIELKEPSLAEIAGVTKEVFKKKAHILEINSKSGLYALYCAYSVYRERKKMEIGINAEKELCEKLWKSVLEDNIFVLCKTPMARSITKRTLSGFTGAKTNIAYIENLVEKLRSAKEKLNAPRKTDLTLPEGQTSCSQKDTLNAPRNTLLMPRGAGSEIIDEIREAFCEKSVFSADALFEDEGVLKEEDGNMKFDAIVGNPPYQVMANGDANGSDPIYHLFIDTAINLGDKVSFIHPARFLFNAGKTPKDWNEKMLNDEHYKVVKYWANSTEVFPTVDIKGGVAVTYWDKKQIFGKIGTFIPYPELASVLKKVLETDFKTFADLVYTRTLYRFTDNLYKENPWAKDRPSKGHLYDMSSNAFDIFPELFFDEKPNDENEYAGIYGLSNKKRVYKWIKKSYVKVPDNFDFYKVLVPAANGSGAIGEVLSTPVIGQPVIGHTETFLSVGKFDTQEEAENCMKYIKTKFARAMLGTLKITQHNIQETWQNVPLQDFASASDIDWSRSIPEIDQQLYAKYGLSAEEVEFIEKNVREME